MSIRFLSRRVVPTRLLAVWNRSQAACFVNVIPTGLEAFSGLGGWGGGADKSLFVQIFSHPAFEECWSQDSVPLLFWTGVHLRVAKCNFPPPELETTQTTEEHLKDTSVSMVRRRPRSRSMPGPGSGSTVTRHRSGYRQFARTGFSSPYASLKPSPIKLNQVVPSIWRVRNMPHGESSSGPAPVVGDSRRSRQRRRTAAGRARWHEFQD